MTERLGQAPKLKNAWVRYRAGAELAYVPACYAGLLAKGDLSPPFAELKNLPNERQVVIARLELRSASSHQSTLSCSEFCSEVTRPSMLFASCFVCAVVVCASMIFCSCWRIITE